MSGNNVRSSAKAAITALGAVTSVGRSATATSAAIRARIARPRKVSHFHVLDAETQDMVPLTAHPIEGYTEGFFGLGRWMRMARGGLRDLMETPGLPAPTDRPFWSRTGMVVVTPSPDDELFEPEGADGLQGILEQYVRPLRDFAGLPIRNEFLRVNGLGPAGAAAALETGLHELEKSGLERLLVVAADSQLDPKALELLTEEGRLKAGDNPVGLMPGEAGACFLLERLDCARRRGALPQALVSGAATAQEENHLFSDKPNLGIGLATCVRKVLETTSPSARFEGDVYSDLNGETWRSQEWGTALVRLKDCVGEPALHLPCTSVGDLGAASGVLGVCLASQALMRGHTRTGHTLVISSSHWGDTGCISLHPANG